MKIFKFTESQFQVSISVLSIILPYAALLIGRNFSPGTIDSSTIFNYDFREVFSVISCGLALLAIVFGLKHSITPSTIVAVRIINRCLILYLMVCFFSLFWGIFNNNPTKYILGDFYLSIMIVINYWLGYFLLLPKQSADRALKYITFSGMGILFYELIYAILKGSLLPIRYGSGIGSNLFPVVLSYFGKKKIALTWLIMIFAMYFIASNSRLNFILMVLILFVFFGTNLVQKKSFLSRIIFFLITIFIFFFIVPPLVDHSNLSWQDRRSTSAYHGLFERFRKTINIDIHSLELGSLMQLSKNFDASTYGRFVEAESAINHTKNSFVGNGFGATFKNSRYYLANQANDHYVHITPVLIFLRQGFLGLVAFITLMYFIMKAYYSVKFDLAPLSIESNLVFIGRTLFYMSILKFFVASGSFFPGIYFFMFFSGMLIRNIQRNVH